MCSDVFTLMVDTVPIPIADIFLLPSFASEELIDNAPSVVQTIATIGEPNAH
jgi:hypothetical protein